jgi:hypothetical protein
LVPQARQLVLLWLALALIFVGVNWGFLCLQSHTDVDDYAANAMQIHNAKPLKQLYGNYSRWGFHHPGPACAFRKLRFKQTSLP